MLFQPLDAYNGLCLCSRSSDPRHGIKTTVKFIGLPLQIMNYAELLFTGVAEGLVLPGLLLITRDQIFEDTTLMESDDIILSQPSSGAESLCLGWKSALVNFFAQGTPELELPAVTALRELRAWSHKITRANSSGMEQAILASSSGLGHELLRIAHPQVDLEKKTPYMSLSFQRYRWKESLLGCLVGFVDLVVPPAIGISQVTKRNALEFLQLLSLHRMCPFRSNYASVFAFSSEKCFLVEAVRWMLPTMASKLSPESGAWISQASLSHLFRHICGFTPKELEALGLDEELLLVLILSAQLRLLRRKVSKDFHTRFRHEVHPSTGVCRLCYFEPEDSKCIRYWTVQSTPHTEIHGKVVTPYPTNDPDRLTPTLGLEKNADYVHLADLKLRKIASRPLVLARCQRDVTLLIEAGSPKKVLAGVSFNTFSAQDLQEMRCDASAAKEIRALKRGYQFQRFRWGQMHPIGSRKPCGGRPGDTYTGYAGMEVTDTEHIRLLFSHAADVERMVAAVAPLHPDVTRELRDLSAEVNSLGGIGATAYYCWNFVALQHVDHDATWTISLQTCKEARQDEFNFVLMDLGCYVETRENSLWWFHGSQTHGTVVPRLSSMSSNKNLSQGIAVTLPLASLQGARNQNQARDAYVPLAQRWNMN
ncbi:hypothetical protein EV424DRAFT_1546056 [Suillus variegatus]|nr:hypothetical protein EV424DRAFT_1546056 [Suillus variegatus]